MTITEEMAAIFEVEAQSSHETKSHLNINRLDSSSDYNTFFHEYMKLNIPCIITNIGCDWIATKYWVEENKPNLSYMNEEYGNLTVTIYDCNKRHYNSQETETKLLQDYISSWQDMKRKCYYLKDWHLQNTLLDNQFYDVPVFFASDWLNEFLCEHKEDDYRFVYVGPENTWTPFHADVFMSYSWSVNVCGEKKWLLFPPGQESKLKDELGNIPYDLEKTSLQNCTYFEIIQKSNEALFIPSGWYHQVWNMKDTISINHNWINGCNIKNMWNSLEQNLLAVQQEIQDCQDMDHFEEHCQVMLKASYGLDFTKFYQFLKYIAVKRINFLEKNIKIISYTKHELGRKHALFDLESIKCVLKLFLDHSVCKNLNVDKDSFFSDDLLNKICECINNKS